MQIKIPQDVTWIISELNKAGYEAYIVGGCVRDFLLKKEPNDWDITTSAKPEEVKALFHKTIDTGIQHGTVTVMKNRVGYEVTTYRIDGEYLDGRHPKEVTFTASLEEDLKRRDFTINAMAYHPESGLVDIFEGYQDLQKGIIRCVGNPVDRFTEDALRMMRAIRFAAQLDYEIEENTFQAICKMSENIKHVSAERIRVEMMKLLVSDNPYKFKLFYESGITRQIMPEFDAAMETTQNNPHHMYSVGEHILQSLQYIKNDRYLRISMLLHDIAKPVCKTTDEEGIDHFYGHQPKGAEMVQDILKRLKFDNDTIRMATGFTRYHDFRIEKTAFAMRKALNQIGEEFFPMLFEVKYADTMAQSTYQREEKLADVRRYQEIYQQIIAEKQCYCMRDLAVNGKDLISLGMAQGKEMGEILGRMLEDVIEKPEHNIKEYLIKAYIK